LDARRRRPAPAGARRRWRPRLAGGRAVAATPPARTPARRAAGRLARPPSRPGRIVRPQGAPLMFAMLLLAALTGDVAQAEPAPIRVTYDLSDLAESRGENHAL